MAERSDISIVIPSAGAPTVFPEVLKSIFSESVQPQEVIIVDDAMDANAYGIVDKYSDKYPVYVLPNRGQGVSAARNAGARAANGNIILFIDTDVILRPGSLETLVEAFQEPEVEGVVGVQSAAFRFSNFFSRWKNHWMRYTYRRLSGHIHLFYTSCAAIRKSAFLKTEGFDENYRLPSIEDTVFGTELGRHNIKIKPVPDFEVEHVKGYTMQGVLRTDRMRSAALVKYTLRNLARDGDTKTGKTSVPFAFIIGSLVMICFWISLAFSLCTDNGLLTVLPWVLLGSLWALNMSWLKYLIREEGIRFMIQGLLFLPLDVTWVDIGMVQGVYEYLTGSRY